MVEFENFQQILIIMYALELLPLFELSWEKYN